MLSLQTPERYSSTHVCIYQINKQLFGSERSRCLFLSETQSQWQRGEPPWASWVMLPAVHTWMWGYSAVPVLSRSSRGWIRSVAAAIFSTPVMPWPCAWSHCLVGRWTFSPAWGPEALDQVFIKCVSALSPIPGGLLCSLPWGKVPVCLAQTDGGASGTFSHLRTGSLELCQWNQHTSAVNMCVWVCTCVVVPYMSRCVSICVYKGSCQRSTTFTASLRVSENSTIQFLHDLTCFLQPSICKGFCCSDAR